MSLLIGAEGRCSSLFIYSKTCYITSGTCTVFINRQNDLSPRDMTCSGRPIRDSTTHVRLNRFSKYLIILLLVTAWCSLLPFDDITKVSISPSELSLQNINQISAEDKVTSVII